MRYLFIIAIVFSFISCEQTQKEEEKPEKKELGNFKKTEDIPSCDCVELEVDSTNNIKLLKGEKFTGVCFTYYPNDPEKKMEEIQFLDGKIHGYYRVYSPNDNTVLTESQYVNGKKKGTATRFKCNCDELEVENLAGQNKQIYSLNGENFTGICEKYSKDGKLKIMDMEFVEGLRDGKSIYYDQNGNPITADVHEKGKFMKTIVYTEEEVE